MRALRGGRRTRARTDGAAQVADGRRLALEAGEDRARMALLQALLDQRAQDDLEADGKPQLGRRASRQYTRSIEHVGRQYQEDLRPGVVHTGSPRCLTREVMLGVLSRAAFVVAS